MKGRKRRCKVRSIDKVKGSSWGKSCTTLETSQLYRLSSACCEVHAVSWFAEMG